MSDEELIELVKRYSVLYDMSSVHYRDHSIRNNAWEEIAEQLHTTGKFSIKCNLSHLLTYFLSVGTYTVSNYLS